MNWFLGSSLKPKLNPSIQKQVTDVAPILCLPCYAFTLCRTLVQHGGSCNGGRSLWDYLYAAVCAVILRRYDIWSQPLWTSSIYWSKHKLGRKLFKEVMCRVFLDSNFKCSIKTSSYSLSDNIMYCGLVLHHWPICPWPLSSTNLFCNASTSLTMASIF